jgi:hypothetical protein
MYGAVTTKARRDNPRGGLLVDPTTIRRQLIAKRCTAFLMLAVLGGSVWLLWNVRGDLHTRFWLGRLPEVALAVQIAASLSVLVTIYRKDSGRQSHLFYKHRRQFVAVLLLACALVACGSHILRSGIAVVGSLEGPSCGTMANSTASSLEKAHHKLATFAHQCHAAAGNDGAQPVDQCPGFGEAFPAPAPYATYLKRMELRDGCVGFCHKSSRRLFAPPAEARQEPSGSCAQALGDHIWTAAMLVGAPSVAVGLLISTLAVACYFYDDF